MPDFINLKTYTDVRGKLTVLEQEVPFQVKRIFYIYGVDQSERGKHRHRTTIQAAICIHGKCVVSCDNGLNVQDYYLNDPAKCLILYPADWHTIHHFSDDAVLLVLASTFFDPDDYIFEPYPARHDTL